MVSNVHSVTMSEEESEEEECSIGGRLIKGYDPWIADVDIDSVGGPWPERESTITNDEIRGFRRELENEIMSYKFKKPISLLKFCYIAPERWMRQEKIMPEELRSKCCLLV